MTFCCLPSGLPHITFRIIFWRIRCVSACCGGKIVIEQFEQYLYDLYYNPESAASFGGVDAVYRTVKNGKFKISRNKI